MPLITPGMIAGYAAAAGFEGGDLVTAVAVAMAESGGRTDAVGDAGRQTAEWGPSIGLWQIRSLKDITGTNGVRDASKLKNPLFNARAAWVISKKGTDWSPWSVYNSKRYLMFLPVAQVAALSPARVGVEAGVDVGEGPVGDAVSAAGAGLNTFGTGLSELASMANKAGAWIGNRRNWVRVAQVIGGVILIGAGLTVAARPIERAVGMIPVGKIAKKVTGGK